MYTKLWKIFSRTARFFRRRMTGYIDTSGDRMGLRFHVWRLLTRFAEKIQDTVGGLHIEREQAIWVWNEREKK